MRRFTGSLTSIYPALLAVMEKVPEGGSPVTFEFQRQNGNCFPSYTDPSGGSLAWFTGTDGGLLAASVFNGNGGVSCITDSR